MLKWHGLGKAEKAGPTEHLGSAPVTTLSDPRFSAIRPTGSSSQQKLISITKEASAYFDPSAQPCIINGVSLGYVSLA